ncbi:MAG: hypothetical protein HN871_08195, partial [Alphaproteobacteria bacterium]|nr:hypothetical protein [Alphaproteobacteria bacterium]
MKKSTAQIIAGAGAASLIAMSAAFAGGAADTTTSQSSSGVTASGQASETVSQTSASAASANATQSTANSSATETAELPQATAARQKQEKKGFDAVENDELVIDTASIGDGDGMGSIQIQWQISDDGDVWLSLPGAIRPSFVPRDSEVGRY